MKKITTLLVVLVASAVIAQTTSNVDTLIGRITGDYEKAVDAAETKYEKSVAPLLKRYGAFRDKSIVLAGDRAIKRLNAARKGVPELDGIAMEKEIEKIRASIDERVGASSSVDPGELKWDLISLAKRMPRFKYKDHTYLAFTGKIPREEASTLCKKMGGHLAYIETPGELAFLAKTFLTAADKGWWTGARRTKTSWQWGDSGKPVDGKLWVGTIPKGGHVNLRPQHRTSGKPGLFTKHYVAGFICEWE